MAGTQRPLESLPESRVLGIKSHPEPLNVLVCGAHDAGKTALITRVSLTVAMSSIGHLARSRLHQQYCVHNFVTGYNPFEDDCSCQRIFSETPFLLEFIEVPESWALKEMPALKELLKRVDTLLFVYDVGDRESFEKMENIYKKVSAALGEGVNVPIGIVAAKSDTPKEKWQVKAEEESELASRLGGVFATCSAKEGEGVEHAVEKLVKVAVEGKINLLRERQERHRERMKVYQGRAQ